MKSLDRRHRHRHRYGALALALLLCLCAVGVPADEAPWSDSAQSRLAALALIQTLNAELLSSRSATLTLEQWCREHALAADPVIIAHRDAHAELAPTAAQRRDLQVSDEEPVRYRRVQLTCGNHVLSVADNWYVPGRLTPAMNHQLEDTQIPFGKVVQPLSPQRETLEVHLLWSPLPQGWEHRDGDATAQARAAAHATLVMPEALFEHRALLYSATHQPIAEVHEVYQRDLLAFPEPRLP